MWHHFWTNFNWLILASLVKRSCDVENFQTVTDCYLLQWLCSSIPTKIYFWPVYRVQQHDLHNRNAEFVGTNYLWPTCYKTYTLPIYFHKFYTPILYCYMVRRRQPAILKLQEKLPMKHKIPAHNGGCKTGAVYKCSYLEICIYLGTSNSLSYRRDSLTATRKGSKSMLPWAVKQCHICMNSDVSSKSFDDNAFCTLKSIVVV